MPLGLVVLGLLTASAAPAAEFYVAPDGTPQGDGSKAKPWDLATALAHPDAIKPGDTIWLQKGTYGQGGATLYTASVKGTQEKPIIVRAVPHQRVTIDGGIEAPGSCQWTWFWGFEITNSSPNRRVRTNERPFGLNMQGRGQKAINLIVHDVGHPAIGFWVGVGDTGEISGCIFWADGLYDMGDARFPDGWTRGSAIYTQNREGTRLINDIIAFRLFTTAINIYTEGGYSDGFHCEGNICFDNPDWNLWATGGRNNPLKRLKMIDNLTYRRRDDSARNARVGYNSDQQDAVYQGNYLVAGKTDEGALHLNRCKEITVLSNTIIGGNELAGFAGQPTSIKWDNNHYFGGSAKPFHADKTDLDWEGWRKAGYDAHGSYNAKYPTEPKVFVRPNKYEKGRGHVAIYNWPLLPAVPVDLSPILQKGDKYEIRDAQNYYGKPVAAGTYDGQAVSIPMNLTEIAMPVGEVPHIIDRFKHTAPEFGVFVVIKLP